MESFTDRKRRSEKMTKEEHKAFIKLLKSFDTKYDAHIQLGISRPTLDAIIYKGSGSPDTIQKIRIALNPAA